MKLGKCKPLFPAKDFLNILYANYMWQFPGFLFTKYFRLLQKFYIYKNVKNHYAKHTLTWTHFDEFSNFVQIWTFNV